MNSDLLVLLFIITIFIQSFIGKKIHGFILNPITLINVIFFLHNWSFSFSKLFVDDLEWFAPGNVSYNTQSSVLTINLISIWLLFFGYVLFFKRSKRKIEKKTYDFSSYKYAYICLTVIQVGMAISSGNFFGTYGENQPLDSTSAFSPINIFLTSRVIFGSVYLINCKKKDYIYILLFEVLISVISGGRKTLVIIFISFLLSRIEKIKINPSRFFKVITGGLAAVYFIGFISIYRLFSGTSMSFVEKLSMANEELTKNIGLFFTAPLASVNSEGVQNWVYQLIESGQMKPTYGLSYVQAIVNTVILRPFQGDLVNYQAAYYFKYIAYPDVDNHGWDFSYTAEAIMNFNYFAPIVSFILGIILAFIYKKVTIDNYYRSFYFIFVALLYIHFRTDSTALMRLIFFYIFFFFLFRKMKLIKIKKIIR